MKKNRFTQARPRTVTTARRNAKAGWDARDAKGDWDARDVTDVTDDWGARDGWERMLPGLR